MSVIAGEAPFGQELSDRAKWLVLLSLMLCMFTSALNGSVMATATPRILADLGGFSLLAWVFTVYVLTSTVVIPVVGKLSDLFGRKVFLIAGVAVFAAGSAACGAAPSMIFLVVARAVQGIGGGVIMSSVFSTLSDLFPPVQRAKYISLFFGASTAAALTGPAVGGFLADGPGWRWCFYLNLPVSAIAITFLALYLPNRRSVQAPRIDFLGAALISAATTTLLLALAWSQKEYGWGSVETVGLFAATVALSAAFVLQERRHPEPIIPLHLFRNRIFVQANVLSLALSAALFGGIQYLPTFIQVSLDASATSSGLISTPQSAGLFCASIVGGQLIGRTGRCKYQLIAGSALVLAATILMQTLDIGVPKWHISAFILCMGLGSGLTMPTITIIIQSALPQAVSGVATSARLFFMQIGQVMGAAILGVVLATSYEAAFDDTFARQAEIPASVAGDFDDPTFALDRQKLATVRSEMETVPGGPALLEEALAAQRKSVATAIQHVFFGAAIFAAVVLVLTVTLPEIPLRRTFAAPEPAGPEPALREGAAPAPATGGR